MIRVRQRKSRRERQLEAQGKALVGMVDAALIMAAADGELTRDEVTVVAQVIDGFFDGQIKVREVEEILMMSIEAIDAQGIEARIDALADNLPTPELRGLALAAAAAVALSDDTGDDEAEDETYYDIADALGISQPEADSIWADVEAQYA